MHCCIEPGVPQSAYADQVQKRLKEDLAITHRDSLYEVGVDRVLPDVGSRSVA